MLAGIALSLLPWSVRSWHTVGNLSPLPQNGGIVLHQVYNEQIPGSAMWIRSFVNYLNPSEIWRGYAAETELRLGRALTPPDIDRYGKIEAISLIRAHPERVLQDATNKSLMFLANSEIPNNRSSTEEQMFSPVLGLLPAPMAGLLAVGLAGAIWLALQARRWLIVAAPLFAAWSTVALFWAEDRFRFHAVPALPLPPFGWMLRCSASAMLDGVLRLY